MTIVRASGGIYDEQLTGQIIELIAQGASENAAVGIAGVHKATYAQWISKGRNDPEAQGIYGKFYIAVQRAKGIAEYAATKKILDSPDWQAARFLLTVRDHETWSERPKIAEQAGMSPDSIERLGKLSIEDLEKMLETGNQDILADFKVLDD